MKRSAAFFFSLQVALLSLSLFIPPASAAVIYDNGNPDYTHGFTSDFGLQAVQVGDDFTLNSGATVITDIHWWGFYFDEAVPVQVPPNDSFTIRIFDIVSGVPATNPFYEIVIDNNLLTRENTGNTIGSLEVFEYSVDLSPISLTAGTSYLLSIVNDRTQSGGGGYGYWNWATSASDQNSDYFARLGDGNTWVEGLFELAFNLTGPASVPEPPTLALLAVAFAGLSFARRRRKS